MYRAVTTPHAIKLNVMLTKKSELRLHKFLLLRFQPLRLAARRSGLVVD